MNRKLMSLFLSLIMLISLLPITVYTESNNDIKPQFEDARYFSEGLAAVKKNGKWGFIDKTGKLIIDYQFDGADKNGFHEGLAGVKVGSKYGFVDRTGKLVAKPQFGYVVEGFQDGIAHISGSDLDESQGSYSVSTVPIDRNGNLATSSNGYFTTKYSEGMRVIRLNGKAGFEDEAGNIVIPPQFDKALPFKGGFAQVCLVVNNVCKWGYVDKAGKLIIKCEYDYLPGCSAADAISPDGAVFFDGLAIVHDSVTNLYGAIDKSGKQVLPTIYQDMTNFGEGLFGVLDDSGMYGYIDKSGKEVLPHEFLSASQFKNGLALVETNNGKCFIDKSGNTVIKLQYDDAQSFIGNVAPVCKNGKWGLIDKTGKEIQKPQYSGIQEYRENHDYIEVEVDDKEHYYGILDKNGKEIIKPKYFEISEYKLDPRYFLVSTRYYKGLCDRNGNEVVKPLYGSIYVYKNLFILDGEIVTKSGAQLLERSDPILDAWCDDGNIILSSDLDQNRYVLIDAKSAKVLCKAEYIGDLSEGLASVCTGGKWGYIDKTGSFVIKPQSGYIKMNDFHSGLAVVYNKDKKMGFIDKTGKFAIKPQYDSAFDFEEGLAAVEKNKNWGYIDTKGNEVVNAIYDAVGDFVEGVAEVERNKKSGLIDKNGKDITKLLYDKMFYDRMNKLFDVEKGGKHGVIDLTGKEVVPVLYEDIDFSSNDTDSSMYSEGTLKVKLNGKWGFFADTGNVPDSTYQTQVNQAISARLIPENLQYGYKDKIYAAKMVSLVSTLVENKNGKSVFSLLMEKGKNTDNGPEAYDSDRRSTALYKLGILQDNICGFGMQYFIGKWVAWHKGNRDSDFLTREQAAILLTNTAKFYGADIASPKSGASDYNTIPADSRKAVDFVISKGIMGLKQNSKFDPNGTVTMQEACAFMLNLNNLLK